MSNLNMESIELLPNPNPTTDTSGAESVRIQLPPEARAFEGDPTSPEGQTRSLVRNEARSVIEAIPGAEQIALEDQSMTFRVPVKGDEDQVDAYLRLVRQAVWHAVEDAAAKVSA